MPVNTKQRVDGPPMHRDASVSASVKVIDREKRVIRLSFSSEDVLVERAR